MRLVFSVINGFLDKKNINKVFGLGYIDLKKNFSKKNLKFLSYPVFHKDIELQKSNLPVVGKIDLKNKLKQNSRLGFRGICSYKDSIYATTHNSIYQIDKKNFSIKKILINNLMYTLHSCYVDNKNINFSISKKDKDYLVICDKNAKVIKLLYIDKYLKVNVVKNFNKYNWRSEDFETRTLGNFHINYIQKKGDLIYLTSRPTSSFLVLNIKNNKCFIMPKKHPTPTAVHDGKIIKNNVYFTSIDAKILIYENFKNKFVKKDQKLILLDKSSDNSWCRGVEVYNNYLFTSNKGLYNYPYFEILKINLKNLKKNKIVLEKRNFYKHKVRYINIFDFKII